MVKEVKGHEIGRRTQSIRWNSKRRKKKKITYELIWYSWAECGGYSLPCGWVGVSRSRSRRRRRSLIASISARAVAPAGAAAGAQMNNNDCRCHHTPLLGIPSQPRAKRGQTRCYFLKLALSLQIFKEQLFLCLSNSLPLPHCLSTFSIIFESMLIQPGDFKF